MITDKDEARRLVTHAFNAIRFESKSFIVSDFVPPVEKAISRIRAESAKQARKEAAERAVAFIRTLNSESMDLWGEYEDNGLRAAILGDSTTDHIPDIGEKLAIAVKALKSVISYVNDNEPTMGHMAVIVEDALKEIQ